MRVLLVLGAGYTGKKLIRRAVAAGLVVRASVRNREQIAEIAALGAEALLLPELDASIREWVTAETHAVVTFPPDGITDARVAPALAGARAITYISSTGVYGELQGHIDDSTPLPPPSQHSAARLAAEAAYRNFGATVLRCPGIYGSERGLHRRLLRGEYALPGDGSATLSRIHVYDLVSFILASAKVRSETFVVGDLEPATHREVVTWLCETYGLPFPSSAAVEGVHRTLRANRAIDSQRARKLLEVELCYPTFREGMAKGA